MEFTFVFWPSGLHLGLIIWFSTYFTTVWVWRPPHRCRGFCIFILFCINLILLCTTDCWLFCHSTGIPFMFSVLHIGRFSVCHVEQTADLTLIVGASMFRTAQNTDLWRDNILIRLTTCMHCHCWTTTFHLIAMVQQAETCAALYYPWCWKYIFNKTVHLGN